MTEEYYTVAGKAEGELVEKRSKFIATVLPVHSQEEAMAYIDALRSKYWDARHNVYAYTLLDGQIKRYSDDGEPSGTAGVPVLNVIEKLELKDTLVVVTRYFGGILLGTGGLVRAYSGSAQGVVASADIKTMTNCDEIEIKCDYGMFDTLNNMLKEIPGGIISSDFTDSVLTKIYIDAKETDGFCAKLIDVFGGKIEINKINSKFYPI